MTNAHLTDPGLQHALHDQYILGLDEPKLRLLAKTLGVPQHEIDPPDALITRIFEVLAKGMDSDLKDTPVGSPNLALQAARGEMDAAKAPVGRVLQINETLLYTDGRLRTWMAPTVHVVVVNWPHEPERKLFAHNFMTPCDTLCHIWYSTGGTTPGGTDEWSPGWHYLDAWVKGDPETPAEVVPSQAFGPFPTLRAVMAAIYKKYPQD